MFTMQFGLFNQNFDVNFNVSSTLTVSTAALIASQLMLASFKDPISIPARFACTTFITLASGLLVIYGNNFQDENYFSPSP